MKTKTILRTMVSSIFIVLFLFTYANAQTFTKDLQKGMYDNEVTTLQQFLNSRGYIVTNKGEETTFFGNKTKEALTFFQQDNNLPALGNLDETTRNFLNLNTKEISKVDKEGEYVAETVSITVNIDGNGLVTGGQPSYTIDQTASLGAIPNTGYHLDRWVGCTSVSGITCYVKMNSNKTVTAYFLPGDPQPPQDDDDNNNSDDNSDSDDDSDDDSGSNSSGGSRTNRQSNSTNNTDQINNQSVINIIRILFASGILTKQQHDIVIAVLSSSGGTVTQQQTSSGSTSCLILTKVMYRGLRDQNTNGEVTKLQRFLVSKGYLSSTFNSFGSFDLLTENALKRFQVDYKVVSGPNAKGAGGIGSLTQNKIKELTCQ